MCLIKSLAEIEIVVGKDDEAWSFGAKKVRPATKARWKKFKMFRSGAVVDLNGCENGLNFAKKTKRGR